MSKGLKKSLREWADGHGFISVLLNARRIAEGYQPIFLDHRVKALPRYGYGRPPHLELARIFADRADHYGTTLQQFLRFTTELLAIPKTLPFGSREPSWVHPWLEGLDTLALYGFVATQKPSLIVEIGSGYSTKVIRHAIKNHGLPTKVISIDPQPRAEIDDLCDEVIRQPLEACDLSLLARLQRGDILFMDGSHRCFMNSDVTVFFLEVLPKLPSSVLVHMHDIFLPEDYPAHWMLNFYPHRYWSEQYLLAASLLAGHQNYDVLLPNHYISITPHLSDVLNPLWANSHMKDVPRTGSSFWIQIR